LQDVGQDIASDKFNNIYTTGFYSSHINFGSITLNSHGLRDIFLSKIDSTGHFVWVISAGGGNMDEGKSVCTDINGNIYISGVFSGTATFSGTTISSNGFQDMFVAKYNSSGVLQWVRSGGGSENDAGNSVAVDRNGNVAVTGQFIGSAQFGPLNLVSQNDPVTNNPTIDIFTVKYDSSGTIQWAKKGSAKYTDRGMDAAFDPSGNLYVTGQFSDTISFGQVHNNSLYNAIFLIKYDQSGNEVWFRKMGGGIQNISYGIAVNDDSEIYLTGDFKGNMFFFNSSITNLNTSFPNGIFLAKYDDAGNFLWAKATGSDGEISSRNLALDDSSNAFIIGTFTCKLSAFANVYGQGCFNSVGYHDVFASKFDMNGNFQWARNYGGQYDDEGNGIAVNQSGQAVITGCYLNRIDIPCRNYFIRPPNISIYFLTTHYVTCADTTIYGYGFASTGSTDLFILNSFDPKISPFYYYNNKHDSLCQKPFVGVQIDNYNNDNHNGKDTIVCCGGSVLYACTQTSSIQYESDRSTYSPGPLFKYQWSTGETTREIMALLTGYYSLTITTIDGCFLSTDSIFVIVNPVPENPRITDSKGVNINSNTPNPIHVCRPDSVNFIVTNAGNDSISWDINSHFFGRGLTCSLKTTDFPGQSISGRITRTDSNGCTSTTVFYIDVDSALITIIPKLKLANGQNDSILVCAGNPFYVYLYDSIVDPDGLSQCGVSYASPNWSVSPNIYSGNSCPYQTMIICTPVNSGWYQITVSFSRSSRCGGFESYFLYKDVYATVNPNPVVSATILGNLVLCPGDSTTLTASGGPNYSWTASPPNIIHGNVHSNTIIANGVGSISVSVTDTNIYHCVARANAAVYLHLPTAPVIRMIPSNGLICPNDSVKLMVNMQGNYHWQGPSGPINDNTSFTYQHFPGYYYCIVDTATCQLSSNSLELKQYATPYLAVIPSTMICPNSSVELNVITNDNSIIQWQNPFSGSSVSQQVSIAGTYTCSVTSCNIQTIATATLTASTVSASIIASGPITFCPGDSVQLTANPGMVMYQWSPDLSLTPSIVVYQSGNYTVTTTDGYGCTAVSAPTQVSVGSSISPPVIQSNAPICSGDTLILSANFLPGITYTWSGPNSFASIIDQNFLSPAFTNRSGNYTLTAIPSAGCNAVSSISVVIDSISPTRITPVGNSCPGAEVVLHAAQDPQAFYSWIGPNNFTSNSMQIQISDFNDQDTGIYSVQVSKGTCLFNDSLRLDLTECDLLIPNVFTPNGDGRNDFFEIKSGSLESIDCTIYNRWGRIVGSWNSISGKWDGTDFRNGTKLSDGVYYYILNAKLRGKTPTAYHGYLELLRDE